MYLSYYVFNSTVRSRNGFQGLGWMKKEKSFWFFLLSHHPPHRLHHTLHFRVGERDVYLCARCTGNLLGFIASFFMFSALPTSIAFVLMALFPLPTTIDWVTQALGIRESKNWIRVGTGSLLGIAWGFLFLFLMQGIPEMILYAILVLAFYCLAIYAIAQKTGMLRNYLH